MRPAGLIPRSLLAGTLLFLGYTALVVSGPPDPVPAAESQESENEVTAEGFLYRSTVPDTVIVGSSLAHRLRPAMFDGTLYNLAFGGRGVLDGLGLIERADAAPRLVLVETNLALVRPGDEAYTDPFFTPGLYQLRRVLPPLQERHKPLHDLWLGVEAGLKWGQGALSGFLGRPAHPATHAGAAPGRPTDPLRERMAQEAIERFSDVPGPEETDRRVRQLKRLVDALVERGSTVVFFEMPVDARVCGSPAYAHTRAALNAAFPGDRYPRLPRPDCAAFQTTDGSHLDKENASRFAGELGDSLRRAGLWAQPPAGPSGRRDGPSA